MPILTHFQDITLTKDQHTALEALSSFLESDERVFILQGYAGSGKTTLLKGFVEYLNNLRKPYQLMAPTGRAAKVVHQKTRILATTIHKAIYDFDNLKEVKSGDKDSDLSFRYFFKISNNQRVHNSILIVDEASMVSDVFQEQEFFRFGSGQLLKDLITYSRVQEPTTTSKIIFIGDPAQLPPIGMSLSPALDGEYLEEKYQLGSMKSEMKEVKRQNADNGILRSAMNMRLCMTSGYFNDFNLNKNGKDLFNPLYSDFLNTYRAENAKKIIITYKNKTAQYLNRQIRIEKYGEDLPTQAGDTIIVGSNNYRVGLMNGEFAVVSEASPSTENREVRFNTKAGKTQSVILNWRRITLMIVDENEEPNNVSGYMLENYLNGEATLKPVEQQALYVDFIMRHRNLRPGTEEFKQAIRTDPYFNAINLKYGYAVTCHKAQGGEWSSAFVFWDRGVIPGFNFFEGRQDRSGKTNSDFYRWAYTAVTRASDKLFCVNPPRFSSFSEMTYVETAVKDAFNELAGKTETVEIDFSDEMAQVLEKFQVNNMPLSIQNHFLNRWYILKSHDIEIVEWRKMAYEIQYVFEKGGDTAGFKYWVNGKNEFKSNFQKLPPRTNSHELFEGINKIIESSAKVQINRQTAESILTQVAFDIETEETKPFLKNLYNALHVSLSSEIKISAINHFEYRDRYTFEDHIGKCVVDFEYNTNGFFGRVLPVTKQCNSRALLEEVKEIVKTLKAVGNGS